MHVEVATMKKYTMFLRIKSLKDSHSGGGGGGEQERKKKPTSWKELMEGAGEIGVVSTRRVKQGGTGRGKVIGPPLQHTLGGEKYPENTHPDGTYCPEQVRTSSVGRKGSKDRIHDLAYKVKI